MISSPDGTTVLSSLGWVDKDALWLFDAVRGATETIPLGTGARYASLHSDGSGRFAVAHHFDGRRLEVSVRGFSDPRIVLAHAVVADGENIISGDSPAWQDVPLLYVEYLGFAPWKDFVLLKVLPAKGKIEVQPLGWYDDTYDKMYQGVTGVLALPDNNGALVSVQRSSRLILHDLATGAQQGAIELGSRGGASKLAFRDSGKELWASDYDTVVVLRTDTWRIVRSTRLQGAGTGTQQFIGEFSFIPDQALCAVARPFRGDVVAVDLATLKIRSSSKLGQQPFEVAALSGGRVIARDWQTGALLQGTLERR
ncbi:MAG TPA: hypothetical protein VHE78_02230 [Gemmatimonadaceae bacterium]|nr:hypothetical protein [Gemmatimonadaceae bacterium]